ncbi:MAG: homoserine dehydrogenase [Candidatus Aureabacteria bacterium]|nr:homoserine dehydrogenase [Candidatus Auribacterota bacterium]
MENKIIKFGVIGLGNIGTGVVKNYQLNRELIELRAGVKLELKKVADVDLKNKAALSLPDELFTNDAMEIINDPEISIVVELIGGTGIAKDLVLKAINNKKRVVTANKALIAECGKEIMSALKENVGSELLFEASVGGGIPIIKALREGFVGNKIKDITAIINGTANYILSEMEKNGLAFEEALKSAQEKGFAEADPTFDIEGIDAAHKIAILASIAFGRWIDYKRIHVEGISNITIKDINYARHLGYKIKLLAIARDKDQGLEVRVNPALLEFNHPLSSVDGSYNAVYVEAFPLGKSMLYGKGAGDNPTSSAVIADIVDAARSLYFGENGNRQIFNRVNEKPVIADKRSWVSRYYLRIQADDKPGVLARVAGIFGENNISLSSVLQPEESKEGIVPVIMMTHLAMEKDMLNACAKIEELECILAKVVIIRVMTQ